MRQALRSSKGSPLWLRLNVKPFPDPVDFSWIGMTISNWAEHTDPQGHRMPVSGSKEHRKLDKSELQQD